MGEQLLNLPVPEDGTRFDSYAEFEGPRWPKAYGEGHVTLWRGGKFAAYSITIDDNNSPDWPFWLEVAETYGWKLTWFVIVHPYVWDIYNDIPGSNTGYFGTLEAFRLLGEAGHDIQLHGACGAMNTLDAEAYEDHLVRSMQVLEEAIGAPILTYAYPCGSLSSDDGQHDYREIISRHMIGARGTTGGTTPVHLLDYLNTRSLGVNGLVDGEPSTAFGRIHDKRSFLYSQYRGWCVTLYHGLNEAGKARTLETLDYVKANEDIFWVAPFTDVAKYAQQRESSTLDISLVQPDRIEFDVTDRMKDPVFDHPLTVKLRLDATWTGVVARQDGALIEASVVEHEGVPYAYVEAVPDRGRVVLLKGPPPGSAE
jgi:peptidoglycan/xylan/chitin deacetylase (PgdA/CDA1 family)